MQYTGMVIKGKGRGKSVVGFPTCNLAVPEGFVEKPGVYACYVWVEGVRYRGALHFGATPTFDDTETALEIFILEYTGAEPITQITFELGPYLRPVATFVDVAALRAQIALDVQRVRRAMPLATQATA